MGGGGVARDGSGRPPFAGLLFRVAAGGLRGRVSARGGRILLCLSTLWVARAVLSRRPARASDDLYTEQSAGIARVGTNASDHPRRGARNKIESRTARIPGGVDDLDEFRLAWNAGPLSDLSAETAWARRAHRRDDRHYL